MESLREKHRRFKRSIRNGAAAVECALIAPVLTLLVLGGIDVGQYANTYQKVSDASREGARVAARYTTNNISQVQTAVMDYLEVVSPNVPPATLAGATTVTITDGNGNAISSGDLSKVATGSPLRVRVTLQFDPVRWVNGISELSGSQIVTETTMRRE
jgi:Flp pilus assembly protein TadG